MEFFDPKNYDDPKNFVDPKKFDDPKNNKRKFFTFIAPNNS